MNAKRETETRERQERIDRYVRERSAQELAELLVDLQMLWEADALKQVRRAGKKK